MHKNSVENVRWFQAKLIAVLKASASMDAHQSESKLRCAFLKSVLAIAGQNLSLEIQEGQDQLLVGQVRTKLSESMLGSSVSWMRYRCYWHAADPHPYNHKTPQQGQYPSEPPQRIKLRFRGMVAYPSRADPRSTFPYTGPYTGPYGGVYVPGCGAFRTSCDPTSASEGMFE